MSQAVVGHVPRFFKLKLKKVMVTCRDVFRLLLYCGQVICYSGGTFLNLTRRMSL